MSVIDDGDVDGVVDGNDDNDDNNKLINKNECNNDCNNEICITCKRKIYKIYKISEIADNGELRDIVIPVDTLKFDGKCTFDYNRKQQSIWQKFKKVFRC
jgi:hypothetical protein